MEILNTLSALAENLPIYTSCSEKVGSELVIQNAIEANNGELIKSFISNKIFYANEDKVTIY